MEKVMSILNLKRKYKFIQIFILGIILAIVITLIL